MALVRGASHRVADRDRRSRSAGISRPTGDGQRPRPARFHLVPVERFFLRLHRQFRRRRRIVRERVPDPVVCRVRSRVHAYRRRPAPVAKRRAFRRRAPRGRLPHAGPRRSAGRHRAVWHPDDHGCDVDAVRLDQRKRRRRHDGSHPVARLWPWLPVPVDHADRLQRPQQPQPRIRHRPVQCGSPAWRSHGSRRAPDNDRP